MSNIVISILKKLYSCLHITSFVSAFILFDDGAIKNYIWETDEFFFTNLNSVCIYDN
jgi:hypothetical protein